MLNYKLIIEYHQKGNNNSQVAILCGCARKTVIKVLKRLEEIDMDLNAVIDLPDKELLVLLFPSKSQVQDGYLIPDYKWEEFQMVKHQASIRLCWRRYCKRAAKQNLKAYTLSRYFELYKEYKKPPKAKDMDKVRKRLKDYNFLLATFRNPDGRGYQQMKKDKEEWLQSLHLDENKILDEKDKR